MYYKIISLRDDKYTIFVNGGALPDLTNSSFPSATFQVPFMGSSPFSASTQAIVADPLSIDGFVLTHAADYTGF